MKTSLVIPAYNEARRLGPFLASIATYIDHQPNEIAEILVIDDGSTDETKRVADTWQQKIPGLTVLQHPVNQGKGAAVRTGMQAATGEIIVFMDADGATAITELPKMTAALREADVAVGNRWMLGAETARHSQLRALASWVYRNYMRLFGLGAVDTMCGFKGYRAAVGKALFADLLESRWLFDTEIAYKARRGGYRVVNFPIHWESKDGSKLSSATLIRTAFNIWPLITRIKRQPHM